MQWESMNNIQHYAKGHFFDKDAMRFFNSRIPSGGYSNGKEVFFITSEKYNSDSKRAYTIRKLTIKTGSIETVGEFQQYKTSTKANKEAKKLCSGGLK